jgi:hypothetical protein
MSMTFYKRTMAVIATMTTTSAVPVNAAELIMVEAPGCQYCIEWKKTIGPIYPKTEAGKFAPLITVDKTAPAPFDEGYVTPIIFTPTFVLVEDGAEVGRILGYPGEDFFWALLEQMLEKETDFQLPG